LSFITPSLGSRESLSRVALAKREGWGGEYMGLPAVIPFREPVKPKQIPLRGVLFLFMTFTEQVNYFLRNILTD
jgi:hypothetical protein